ncbi:transposase [Desulfovibrio sp. UIB00]|nr:transposase [Desulfovibrio sp. UIB00]
MGKTLHNWRGEVARMFCFTQNKRITDGFHRKMKFIQRRAHGFRNFKNTACAHVFCAANMAEELIRKLTDKLPIQGLAPAFGAEPTLPNIIKEKRRLQP